MLPAYFQDQRAAAAEKFTRLRDQSSDHLCAGWASEYRRPRFKFPHFQLHLVLF